MKTLWYLTRSTGAVALVLLTVSVVIGIAAVGRLRTGRWPRFAIDGMHRSSSLLAVVFLLIHIATSVLDSFAPISLADAVIPFAGAYRPLWLGLGAVSFDVLLAVLITSLLRHRLGHKSWRAVHWLAYAAWPIAFLHGLGSGSDARQAWMLALDVACLVAVLASIVARVSIGWPARRRLRLGAVGCAAVFLLGLLVWVPIGPLAPRWASRAGTPASLLAPAMHRRSS
ncbi:MAG: ferric reductase-like transmembrane domain-containing protein [Solirubrobacterales bacterium]|nr:ferric reductase-like transmembrane domain-containing protein [Solirubrobacterales bacterium]